MSKKYILPDLVANVLFSLLVVPSWFSFPSVFASVFYHLLRSIPPETNTQSFRRHAGFYPVGSLEWRVVRLGWASWCLIVPLLVDDLKADHFVIIVEQTLFVKVPDPELFTMATAEDVSRGQAL